METWKRKDIKASLPTLHSYPQPPTHTSLLPHPRISIYNSQLVPIIRAQIPPLRLLILRQPPARLPAPLALPPPIRAPHSHEIDAAAERAETDEADADGVAAREEGRVCGEEGVGGDDAADVAEADLPGGADGAAVVAAEVHVEPCGEVSEEGGGDWG